MFDTNTAGRYQLNICLKKIVFVLFLATTICSDRKFLFSTSTPPPPPPIPLLVKMRVLCVRGVKTSSHVSFTLVHFKLFFFLTAPVWELSLFAQLPNFDF